MSHYELDPKNVLTRKMPETFNWEKYGFSPTTIKALNVLQQVLHNPKDFFIFYRKPPNKRNNNSYFIIQNGRKKL